MRNTVFSAPINGGYGETFTLGTVAKFVPFIDRAVEVMVNAAAAWRLDIGPKLALCCKTTDNEVNFTSYLSEAKDRSASTHVVLSSLDTAANGDYFYVGSPFPFSGVNLDIDGANGNASVMTGYYWNGTAWADASITDGTASGGACLAIDGLVYWTKPTAWAKRTLSVVPDIYVMRFQVSAALDSSTTIDEVGLVDEVAANWMYMAASTDYILSLDPSESEFLSFLAATTPALNVSWMKHNRKP